MMEDIDVNSDRRLTFQEFKNALLKMDLKLTDSQTTGDFDNMDTNNDGLIKFTDFCLWVANKKCPNINPKRQPNAQVKANKSDSPKPMVLSAKFAFNSDIESERSSPLPQALLEVSLSVSPFPNNQGKADVPDDQLQTHDVEEQTHDTEEQNNDAAEQNNDATEQQNDADEQQNDDEVQKK